jgi:hypothetical protein
LAKIPLCGLGRYDGKYVQSYLEGKWVQGFWRNKIFEVV